MNIFEYFKKKGIDTIDSSFYTKIAIWDSWYRANVKKFHQYRVYHGAGQYTRCQRKSLGMGKKICEDISDLLLNERVRITVQDDATAKFVNKVLEAANFAVQGNEYQERKAACGTVAYVPYLTNMEVDDEGRVISADVKMDYVVAKNIYPTAWENSRITECIFVFPKTYKRKKYAQFQHHKLEPWKDENGEDLGYQYVIENTVVECSSGAGRELTPDEWNKIPHFEGLAARVETGSDQPQFVIDKLNIANNVDEDGNDLGYQYVIENSVVECSSGAGRDLTPAEWNAIPHFEGLAARVETGSNQPQFIIDKLNIANNVDEDDTNPMGVALFANSIDVLAKIDLEYDSYANEFTLGRKRIFVAPEMLTDANGSQVFDPDDSVFYTLPEDYFKNTKEALHEVNMELRTEQHEQAINNDLNLLSFKCGFGTQYYRFERGTVATATQVISENSDMYRTIRKHEIILQDVLTDLIRTIIRLGKTANVPGLVENTDIVIDFDDSIIEDKQTERAEDRKDVAMGAMGLPEYRAKWYGETEEVAASKLPDQSAGVLM